MILLKEINQLAKKNQTSLLNVARDYLQSLFLASFYQQKEASQFFFKGGTALHLVFKSPRYSEDLNFSARDFNCRLFEDLLVRTLSLIEKNGLKTDLVEVKPTTGGCLSIFSVLIEELLVKVQIEVSLRTPKTVKGEIVLVRTEFMPPFNIQIIELAALVAGKIQALLFREKPRDFYDLYFLLRSDLKVNLTDDQRKKVSREINNLNSREIEKELKEFLPKSQYLIIKDLPKALKTELERR